MHNNISFRRISFFYILFPANAVISGDLGYIFSCLAHVYRQTHHNNPYFSK